MGAGASVAHELASAPPYASSFHNRHSSKNGHAASPLEMQYNEMLDHLRHRFEEEIETLRTKYDDVDRGVLVSRLLLQEVSFTTVEVDDLPSLNNRRREEGRVYLLGNSHFQQPPPSAGVVVATLNPKALGMIGDEELRTVARESLPATANTRTSKKAVELMGSTKVVTERKALKRLGSEMTESMRVLQVKTEKKERDEESRREQRANSSHLAEGGGGGGGGGGGAGGASDAREGICSPGGGAVMSSPRRSLANLRMRSPSAVSMPSIGGRANRLLAPKLSNGGHKGDVRP